LRNASALGAALKVVVHAVHVSTPWSPGARDRRAQLLKLTAGAGITRARTHLLDGSPDLLLPAAARRLRAGVVVMGTMSRRGVRRLFVGNTAERLLDDLRCDVLAVKPARFAAPLPRRRRGIYYLTSMPMA
jgi:universal stress protein E